MNVKFETDFETNQGIGTIIEQGDPSVAQIFSYEERNTFFTAAPFVNPSDDMSHFHLFNFVAAPETNTDLLIGGDSAGLSITFGSPTPSDFFGLENLVVREVREGSDVVFEGFNGQDSTGTALFNAGTTPGFVALEPAIFGNVNRVDVYYPDAGLGGEAPDDAGIIFDDVRINSVPEPDAILGSVILCIGLFVKRRYSVNSVAAKSK
ncbi:hypothetical protein [Acaryochloris thomasi]|uniref:hypothetical protein n=1 Tax=Acaryochloris thomasi TaxID=2929456 RepID=UPI0011B4587C|nr:hypothetical protein [Acaryochloris thomasi]